MRFFRPKTYRYNRAEDFQDIVSIDEMSGIDPNTINPAILKDLDSTTKLTKKQVNMLNQMMVLRRAEKTMKSIQPSVKQYSRRKHLEKHLNSPNSEVNRVIQTAKHEMVDSHVQSNIRSARLKNLYNQPLTDEHTRYLRLHSLSSKKGGYTSRPKPNTKSRLNNGRTITRRRPI